MTILEEWKNELVKEEILHSFYRVQGGKSYKKFSFDGNRMTYDSPEKYTYFSNSKIHHDYYMKKRIDQIALKISGYGTKKDYLSTKNLYTFRSFLPQIQESVKKEEEDKIKLECFSFHFLEESFILMKNNSFHPSRKMRKEFVNTPERVDLRRYGGGYGLNEDWLRLFYLSLFATEFTSIHKEEVEAYLQKLSYQMSNEIEVQDEYKKRLFLSQNLDSSFAKYELIDTLENIVETNSLNPNSMLAKEPKKQIKTFVKTYEERKETAKRLLDSKMNERLK